MQVTVEVRQTVRVSVDESKFTPEFMREFQDMMHPIDSVAEHATWLGELYARGIVDDGPSEFIEGYGRPADMGIKFEQVEVSSEIVPD